MKTNSNKWLLSLLVFMLAFCLVTGAFFACNPEDNDKPNPTPTTEGAEKGVYSSDDVTLTLNGLGAFTLSQGNELFSGVYASDESGTLNLTFAKAEDGTATAKIEGDVLVFTHGNSEYRLYKQLKFVVTFNDGESTSVANVTNGGYASKPADPVKEGYKFVGWYASADFSGKPYSFDTEKVTQDITLYARWIQYDKTAKEFTVSFDLGYNATLASQKTIGGKLLDTELPAPQREGYTFKGWWVSASNDANKLTYQYKDGDAFTADTTLFALWQQDGTTLATLEVTASGASWAGVEGSAKLVITKPDGTTTEHNIGASGSSAYEYDLSAQPAGEYKYTLTYGSTTVERYYLNKALNRVSGFSVVGNSVLLFDGVENAEAYYITVNCGNEAHNHTNVYIGLSTNYNFVNCSMKQGGIEFTVKATAKGYADSVATFKFDRSLEAVTDITYNAATGLLTWASVENAQHYLVKVGDNEYYLGTENKLDLKELPAGELAVSVQAYTEGYNSAAATTAKINKTDIAAPSQLAVDTNSVLTWSAVEGATSYKLQIGNKTATAETNQFTLDSSYISLGNEYEIKVKAVIGEAESLWSDALVVNSSKADAGMFGLAYNKGVFSWTSMLDAAGYEYTVNGGKTQTTTQNNAAVVLNKAGTNQLQVRYLSHTGEYSEWATLEVYAYLLTLDSTGGAGVSNQYKAIGDPVELPETTRLGYEFDGWYNVYGGAEANGAKFTSKTFDGTANLVLYANWTPCTYTITLDYNKDGTGEQETATVTYTKSYTLPVPTLTEEAAQKAFVGWYASADGQGAQFTDELGQSLNAWSLTSDITLYAKYVEAFTYAADGDGYSVKASKSLGYYTKTLVIPSTYNGKTVRSIAEYGFKDYYYLENVSLPDTLESIPSTAFDGCSRIESYTVYATDHTDDPTFQAKYSSVNGSVLQTLYGEITLHLIPTAATGTYRVPNGVTAIGSHTFNKAKFDTVIIPNSVVSVEAEAFVSCSSLKNVIFEQPSEGEDVQSLTIDSKAFNETLYVESFVLPARLAAIDNVQEFFSQFKLLSSIQIEGTFKNQVYASLDEKDGGQNIAGMLANAAKDTIVYCPISLNANATTTEFEIVVPAKIIMIADHAFDSFAEEKSAALKIYNPVTKATFDGIVSVGEYAFNKSRNLEEVVFKGTADPAELTIGKYAFYYCQALTNVTFEEEGSWSTTEDGSTFTATKSAGLAEIGDYAFAYSALNSLSLPNSLQKIGAHAFERCTSLTTLDLASVSPELTFGSYAFAYCRLLTNVELTKNVGEMEFNLVFYECTKLTLTVSPDNPYYTADDKGVVYDRNVTKIIFFPDGYEGEYTIPDTIETIGGAVFMGKASVKSVVISANVKEIGDSAFEDCANLSSVVFVADGEQLTIGAKAFYNCTSLRSIELPGRVVSIGEQCFAYYGTQERVLTTVKLNEGTETIGKRAFFNTVDLDTINIPASVTYIGDEAFWSSGLKNIVFAGNRTKDLEFGTGVFTYCAGLQNVVLPEKLISIPAETFYGATGLKSVTVPTTVANHNDERAIGKRAFYNCAKLTDLVFTKGGTEDLSFGGEAFTGCTALVTLSLPNRIASLDDSKYDLFQMGTNGTTGSDYSLLNPNVYAFENSSLVDKNISNIENIEVEEGGKYFSSYKGVLYNADKTVLVWVPFAKKGNVEIAKETKTLRPSSFYACSGVTSVTFEDGGTEDFELADVAIKGSIPSSFTDGMVFFGCYNLKTITFPARLAYLGKYSLYNTTGFISENVDIYSTGITEVNFDANCKLTTIGDNAFGKSYITELTLPANVATVGKNVFSGSALSKITLSAVIDSTSLANITASASSLKSVIVPEDSQTLKSDYNGQIIYSKDMTNIIYISDLFETDLYTVPATITNIAANAFKDRAGIKAINFAAGTEALTIGSYAFSGTGITSITLPARVSSLGANLFRNCTSLTSVTFEEGYACKTIPDYAFYGCSALTSITIPGEVTSIGISAFNGAGAKDSDNNVSGLTTVTFGLTADGQLSQLTSIGYGAFRYCYALSNIRLVTKDESGVVSYVDNTLPYSLSTLGNTTTDVGVFDSCISLTELALPNNLTYLPKSLFNGCTNLKKVTLPSQLKTIYQKAFANSGIVELDFSGYDDGSLTINEGAFNGASNLTNIDLTKVGTIYLYQTFYNCTSLNELKFVSGMTLKARTSSSSVSSGMYNKGFSGANINHVILEQNPLKSMFEGATGLLKVTLGATVTQIADSAFESCTSLTTVDTSAVTGTLTLVADAFKNCSSLTAFDLTKVTSLGNYAFSGCSSLTSVDLKNVTTIGTYVFQNCSSLTSIGTFNDAITKLQNNMFEGAGLTSIDLANSNIETLGGSVFKGSALTEVVVPDTIYSVGSSLFANCTSLKKAQFLADVATMPNSTFSGCTNLTEVTIGDSVTKIDTSALANTGITEIDLNNVVTLGGTAFENCLALKKVTVNTDNFTLNSYGSSFRNVSGVQFVVPQGSKLSADGGILYVTTDTATKLLINLDTRKEVVVKEGTTMIARNAFRYNTNVEKVTLPQSVTTIEGYYTFGDCTNLKSINLENITDWTTSSESTFLNTALTEVTVSNVGAKVFRYLKTLTTVNFVGDNVAVGKNAFEDATALTTLNGFVKTVGDSAFSGCLSLTSFDAFQNLTSMGNYAFEETGFVNVVIPEGITTIPGNAFKNCTKLTSVTLHSGVKSVGSTAFQGDQKLVEVINHSALTLAAGSIDNGYVAAYALDILTGDDAVSAVEKVGDYLFYVSGFDNYLLSYLGSDTAVTLPASYKDSDYKIYKYAFYKNTDITSVTGNNNVTGIGDYAFSGCTALTTVSGFDKLTYIGDYAFQNCPITNISIADTVETIGDYAFSGCNEIITTEYDNALYLGNSDNLFALLYKAKDKSIESCTINLATEFIGSEAFSGCSALTSIVIPDGVVSIGARAFYNCSALTEIVVPASVKTIGKEAFYGCGKLAKATLNEGLVELGESAFYNCSSLTSIVVPKTVTTVGANLFYNCSALTSATVLGPITKITDYMFYNCEVLQTLVLPDNITEIGESAFNGCKQLTKFDNFGKVKSIGANAFRNCEALTSLGDLSALETIGDQAFYYCDALTEFNVSASLNYIGSRAFYYCDQIASLTLDGTIKFIGSSAFGGWQPEQTIVFTQYTAAPTGGVWNSSWRSSCNATVTWATAAV